MKTLFVGQNSIHLKLIDSTNSYASELLKETKPPEGTLIYTFEQKNGKGQRGNKWQSEPNKNGAFSFLLYPVFLRAEEQFLLTKIASLAVYDLMSVLLADTDKMREIRIKWPNDIYVGSRKIAGILIENTLREKNIQNSIVGIGANINQTVFEPGLNAVSVVQLTGKEFELKSVTEKLCEFLEARYLQLKSGKLGLIHAQYLQRLFRFDEWHSYASADGVFEGKIKGVSELGRLRVELENAVIAEFDLKHIQFL